MSETAQRLMDLAEVRMREAGYHGFSFRELAAEIGIKSASVHHHFPTKADMPSPTFCSTRSGSPRRFVREVPFALKL